MRPARLCDVVRDVQQAKRAVAFALALASVHGCGASTAEPSAGARDAVKPDQALQAAAVSYSGEYTWSSGNPRTFMGPDTASGASRACFLTGISGHFNSWTDAVYVQRLAQGWYLSGSSTSSGVGARARCMTVLEYSPEVGVTGIPSVSLNRGTSWQCFLTGIRGELDGDGFYTTQDWVIVIEDDPWRLMVDGRGGSTTQLWAGARCARALDGDFDPVNPGFPLVWESGENPLPMTSTNTSVCALKSVHGSFQSASSYAAIYRVPFTSSWWMSGSDIGPGEQRWVTASCFS